MEKLIFRNGEIWLGDEYIGIYGWRDENSDFLPTKRKLFWAVIFEHEYQSDDYRWWAKTVPELKARVRKYLLNKEKGIKDLPQISDQLKRAIMFVHNLAMEKFKNTPFGYYGPESHKFCSENLNRIGYVKKMLELGYRFNDGYKIIPLEIYNYL